MKIGRLIGAVVLCLSAVSFVQAQTLADHVPADALVYVSWQGSANLGRSYARSHLKQVIDSSNLRQLFTEFLPQIIAKASRHKAPAQQLAAALQNVLPLVLKHASALYVAPPAQQGPPVPALAIVTQAGNDAHALQQHYHTFIQQLGPTPLPVRSEMAGQTVIFCVGRITLNQQMTLGVPSSHAATAAPPLSKDHAFTNDVQQTLTNPALTIYVNTKALFALVAKAPHPPHRPNPYAVLKALGLTDIQSATIAAGFTGEDWSTAAFINAPAPRWGVLKALVPTALDNSAFKHVPKTAMMVKSYRFSLSTFLSQLDHALATSAPQADTRYQQVMMMLNHMVGQNVVKDLIPAFGDQWTTYMDKSIAGTGLLSVVMLNQPPDPAKASAALTDLATGVARFIAAKAHKRSLHLQPQTVTMDGMTIHYVPAPIVSPAWAVKGKTLFIGLYPQSATAAAAYHGPSILQNAAFRRLRRQLKSRSANTFSFIDLPQALPGAYPQLLLLQGYANVGNLFGIKTPPMIVPPLHKLMHEVMPLGVSVTLDKAGLHYRYRSPFPGSAMIASLQGNMIQIEQTSMMIGILLPALSAARHAARQMSSNVRVHGIVQDEAVYASNHNRFPSNLATMYRDYLFQAQYVLAPNSDVQVPANLRQWSKKKQDQWFAKNASYVLVPGLKNDMNSNTIAVFEKPRYAINGQISVGYDDDHCQSMPVAQVRQAIKQQTGKTMDQLIRESEKGSGAAVGAPQ